MAQQQKQIQITTNATTTVFGSTCTISQVVISCSNAGTAWALTVQDRGASAKVLIPGFTLSVPSAGPIIITFDKFRPRMDSGISAITTGTTPGVLNLWVDLDG